jgi:hypothetical protein
MPRPATREDGGRPLGRTYAAVLLVEALVLAALWLLGRWFA